jgi:hypothetical protein
MSAFKQFTTNDVTITPFNTNKGFSFTGTAITASDVGIEVYYGEKPISNLFISSSSIPTGFVYIQNTTGVYNSIKQLYYANYLSLSTGDLAVTQSVIPGVNREDDRFIGSVNAPIFENYLQSSLVQERYFPQNVDNSYVQNNYIIPGYFVGDDFLSVISIPVKLFGENIVPTTFKITYTSSIGTEYDVIDDGEGNVILTQTGDIVGQIFYSHGMAVFTTGSMAYLGGEMSSNLANLNNLSINFSSSFRIYENQYKCTINENEFQYSLNPTLLSNSLSDTYKDYITGSFFTPYITTVGLYNEKNELLMVGKLSNPIPVSQYTDTTIIVNFDN